MNPVVAAIREEINDALEQRTTALEQLEVNTTRLKHLKQTFEVYTGEQLDIEIPGLEATGEEDVAPDGDSDVTRIAVPEPAAPEPPAQTETPADESPPQQENEAEIGTASEEPAVDSPEAKPELSKRDTVIAHLEQLEITREFTLQDIVEETQIHYGIVRDAAKVAVAKDLIDDQGGRPKIFKRIPEGYGTSSDYTEQPAPEEPIEADQPETIAAPTSPPAPIGEQEPPKDFVDQVFDVIKRNGPTPTHDLPTITGIFDGNALKRATSKLDADGKIEWHDGCWQLAGTKDEQPEQESTEDRRHSPEQQKLRDDILHFIGTKPRTGGQLAELLSIPIKELHPTLEQLRDDGEIKQERLLKRWELA